MPGTEIGRVAAKVRSNGMSRGPGDGYVAVVLPSIVKNRSKGVVLKTYSPNGEEIGSTFHIKAQAIMLEAALKAAIKEMK